MNMEQVLGMVLELEAQSKDIVKQASDRRDALPSDMKKRLGELRDGYMKKAEARIGELRREEAARLDAQLGEVRKSHEAQMQRLTDAADRELENWAELIFEKAAAGD